MEIAEDPLAEKESEDAEKAAKAGNSAEFATPAVVVVTEDKTETLSNPTRVTGPQAKLTSFPKGQRYSSVKYHREGSKIRQLSGFVVLKDSTPDALEEIVVSKVPRFSTPGVSGDEPQPPEPFAFTRYD